MAERVLDVLIAFAQGPHQTGGGDMGVTEIARQVGLDKSRVHRFLTALRNKGFVVVNPKTRRYSLGFRILELGRAAQQLDIEAMAQPVLEELRDRTGETAVLVACIGCERVYLAQAEGLHPVRQPFRVGERRAIPLGASGRVFLAYMSDADRGRCIEAARSAEPPLLPAAEATLRSEIATILETGHATQHMPGVVGARAVAAPVWTWRGDLLALAVAGADQRLTAAVAAETAAPQVLAAARSLTRQLGGSAFARYPA